LGKPITINQRNFSTTTTRSFSKFNL